MDWVEDMLEVSSACFISGSTACRYSDRAKFINGLEDVPGAAVRTKQKPKKGKRQEAKGKR